MENNKKMEMFENSLKENKKLVVLFNNKEHYYFEPLNNNNFKVNKVLGDFEITTFTTTLVNIEIIKNNLNNMKFVNWA